MATITAPLPSNLQPRRPRNSLFSTLRLRLRFPQRPRQTGSTIQSTASSSAAGDNSPPPNLFAKAHPVPFTKGPVFVYPDAYTEIPEAHKKRWQAVVHLLKLNVQQCNMMREHKDNIDYDLQMCGMQPSEAFPHIVVNCSTQLVQDLRKLFLLPHVKRHYHVKCATDDSLSFPRFGIIFYGAEPTKISGVGYEASIMTQGLNSLVGAGLTMCGSRVISNKSPNRFSTIGCVLRVGQSYYGLTAAHTFVDEPAMDNVPSFLSSEDSDTEDDDYSYDFSGMAAEDANDSGAIASSDKVFDSSNEKSLDQITSTIQDTTRECAPSWKPSMSKSSKVYVPAQRTPQVESDLDWAVVDLQDNAHWRPNMYTSETGQLKLVSVSHEFVTHLPPKARDVFIISSRDRAIRGQLRSLPTLRGGSANQANEFWVVSVQGKDTLDRGDSGSIVVDAHDHKVYGHVVSINAYGDLNIVPMKDTIRQIEIVMDGSPVSLHSISDIELSQLLNVSIIDTERLMREWSLCADTLRASRCNTAADSAVAMSKKHRTSSLMQGLQKYLISTNTVHTTQLQSFSSHATSPPLWTYTPTLNHHSSTRHISTEDIKLQNCSTNLRGEMNEETEILWQTHFDGGADYAPLAQGSFGTVYSINLDCSDWRSSICSTCSCKNRHKLALKTFKVDDPERLESFSAESEALRSIQKLSHDNIVKYLGTYQLGGGTFGILFPLANADLKTYMSSSRPTTIRAVVHIFTQLLGLVNALRFLHTGLTDETRNYTKICHMDLKPSNILLMKDHANTEEYTWKITDFGVSVIHDRAPSTSIQRTVFSEKIPQAHKYGLPKWGYLDLDQAYKPLSTQASQVHDSTKTVKAQGDRAYTAPEVELSNKISGASDIWSFGCVILEVLIWLSAGTEVLRRSKEAIAEEDSEHSHGLWVQAGSAKVTLKPTVKRLLDILSECADHEPSLSPLARLFHPGGVLELVPEQRMDAAGTEDQLRSFVDQKDFEKGIKFLMTDFLWSEICDRLFPKPNQPNLESDPPRLESQGTGGLIAGDCTPDLLENIPEKIRSSVESSIAPTAAVQGPLSKVEGATAKEQNLIEAGKLYEGLDRNHGPLHPDLEETFHSAGDHINKRNDTLKPLRRDGAPSQINIRSCPPQSITGLDPCRMPTLSRKMTAEEVQKAVTRQRSQNRSPRTVKMRSGGAGSLRSADTHLHPWTGAC